MNDAAKMLHSKLMTFILHQDPWELCCGSYSNDADNLKIDWEAEAEAKVKALNDDINSSTDINSFMNQSDQEADRVATSISETISKFSMDIANDSTSAETRDPVLVQNTCLCAQLIRACKNLTRWNRILFVQSNKTSTSTVPGPSFVTSTERLCSVGMISIYLSLLQAMLCNPTPQQLLSMHEARDDVARQCATALFHSTLGQAPEPCCKKALAAFVSRLDGVQVMSRLLILPCSCSVNVMLGLVKIVHNLVGTLSNVMEKFDAALLKEASGGDTIVTQQYKLNLFTILVSTLAWSLRSDPRFPSQDPADRRSDLLIEIIHVLFALRSVGSKSSMEQMEQENQEMMTQMGVLIVDILKLPNQDQRGYDCKLAVLLLLMNAPATYGKFLVVNDVIGELLSILWLQLNTIVVERAGSVHSEQNAAFILPILIVLNQLTDSNHVIRDQVKEYIFPPSAEANFMAKVEEHRQAGGKKNVRPLDAPQGTTRWKLIKLMTYTESNVKRCASELLWNICRKDPNEFVLRCGFGNAVHMMGIKGLVQIPNSS